MAITAGEQSKCDREGRGRRRRRRRRRRRKGKQCKIVGK